MQPEPRPLDEQKYEELSGWQEEARKEEKPIETIFEFADAPLMMYPNSGDLTSSWRFILRNYAIELKVGMGKRNGIIAKVRFSAEYLWLHRNLDFVLRQLHTYLASEFFDTSVYLAASEIHICADTVGYDFSKSDWQEGFIRRSSFTPHFEDYSFIEEETDEENTDETDSSFIPGPDKLHMRYRAITGFTFGSHKSAVSAVVYNKSNYIKYKAKSTTWFHVVPGSDSNRARWQLHDAWVVVQMAYQQALSSDQLDMGPIIREHKRVANMDQMVAQMVGCFITLHAWRLLGRGVVASLADAEISDVICDFYPNARDYLEEKERKARQRGKQWDFVEEVRYKQQLYKQAEAAA